MLGKTKTLVAVIGLLLITLSANLCLAQERQRMRQLRVRTGRARARPMRTRPHVIPEGPQSPQEQLTKFHLPPGFEIELVASDPDIYSPLSINFDKRGRLWVTDTTEYPIPPRGPGRDGLKVFEDTTGDGRYDKVMTYVDKLSMPTGAEPVPGGAIVFSIPSIFGCYDTDGDGEIDERHELYTEFGDEDAHGMNSGFTRWLDDWVYACHGFKNSSTVKGSDGHTISMNSGNGYRFRLDGSRIEHTWFGQVNPYGIAFDSLGNLFTADCHSKPAYCLLRGAYYPSFAKPHDGMGFGPQMITHSHGSTAISGIAYYAADQFPQKYRDCVFMGNGVTGRVNCDKVTAYGSSLFGTEMPDFVTCDDRWFRPVEVKLGPDGALYIADFYDCIIGYYEVALTHPRRDKTRGRIWRVVYRGDENDRQQLRKIHDLTQLDLQQLWDRLADPNIAVRLPATHEICDRFGADAVQPVRKWIVEASDPHQRAHGLWVLHRLGGLDKDMVARLAVNESYLVRVHLVKSLADRTDWSTSGTYAADVVRAKLFDENAFVRRAAADALGQHLHADNVPVLLRLWQQSEPRDTYLIHTVRVALRDHLADDAIFQQHAHFRGDEDRTHRIMDVLPGLRNPAAADMVFTALKTGRFDAGGIGDLIHFATRYGTAENASAMADYVRSWQEADPVQQLAAFRAYARALAERGDELASHFVPWAEKLAIQLITSTELDVQLDTMHLIADLELKSLYEPAAEIAADREADMELRVYAIQACAGTGNPRLLDLLSAILQDSSEPRDMRRVCALALALDNTQASRQLMIDRIQTAHHELASDIAAALARSLEGAQLLLDTVAEGKASPLLLRESSVLRGLESRKIAGLSERIDKLTENLPPMDELIAQRIEQRRTAYLAADPDVETGAAVFKKQCGVCHQMTGEGKKFGPDLDGIGVRGVDRLLEDMLDPSRNVDPAFQTTIVLTDRGLTYTGLALRDEGQVLLMVDSEGNELRIPHDEIDERDTSAMSPMPNALERAVTEEEFNHLLSFLLTAVEPLKPLPDESPSQAVE